MPMVATGIFDSDRPGVQWGTVMTSLPEVTVPNPHALALSSPRDFGRFLSSPAVALARRGRRGKAESGNLIGPT
jgi:hypothetical protein